jgi:hypothetical protein
VIQTIPNPISNPHLIPHPHPHLAATTKATPSPPPLEAMNATPARDEDGGQVFFSFFGGV